jgi:hypothetical protein
VRVLVLQISRDRMPGRIDVNFFVKEEERVRSELSHSSLPELVTPTRLVEFVTLGTSMASTNFNQQNL